MEKHYEPISKKVYPKEPGKFKKGVKGIAAATLITAGAVGGTVFGANAFEAVFGSDQNRPYVIYQLEDNSGLENLYRQIQDEFSRPYGLSYIEFDIQNRSHLQDLKMTLRYSPAVINPDDTQPSNRAVTVPLSEDGLDQITGRGILINGENGLWIAVPGNAFGINKVVFLKYGMETADFFYPQGSVQKINSINTKGQLGNLQEISVITGDNKPSTLGFDLNLTNTPNQSSTPSNR